MFTGVTQEICCTSAAGRPGHSCCCPMHPAAPVTPQLPGMRALHQAFKECNLRVDSLSRGAICHCVT